MTASSKHQHKSKAELIAELERLEMLIAGSDKGETAPIIRNTMVDAIEALQDGLAIFDADERLVLSNNKYLELHPAVADVLVPGVHIADIVSTAAQRGQHLNALHRDEAWVAERLKAFRNPGEPIEQEFSDGQWLRVYERKTADGGTVGVGVDISELKHREKQLFESQQRLNDYLEASSDWHWEMDQDCRFSYFSDQFEKVTGVLPSMLFGKTREETGIPDIEPSVWQEHLDNLAARRSFRDFRHPRTLDDGVVVTLSINGKAIFDAAGNFTGYRGTGRDITDLVVAEQNARRAESLLAKAIESIPEGFVLFDAEDRLVMCNQRYRDFASGFSDLIVEGVKFEDLARASAERGVFNVEPDQSEQWATDLISDFHNGAANKEYQFSDGRWIQTIDSPTDDGGHLGLRVDITERKQAEQALQERERRYRQIFDSADICLWDEDFSELYKRLQHLRDGGLTDLRSHLMAHPDHVWDLANCIKVNHVNEATLRLFGAASEEELLGSLDQILPEGAENLFLEEMVAIWEGRTNYRAEVMHKSFTGEDLWVIVTMPVPGNMEEARSVPISVIDITEKKQTEEELARHQDELVILIDERTQELRETEAYLSSAIESISEGFVLYDPNDRMVMCNEKYKDFYPLMRDEFVPGAELKHVARLGFERGVVKASANNIDHWMNVRLTQQATGRGSHEQELPDGRWLLCTDRKTANGYTVGIRTEITEVKQAGELLRQSQKMEAIGQLTGGVAHDFNNILAAIIGNLDLIQTGDSALDKMDQEGISIALRAAFRGAELTDRLLAFSRQKPLDAKDTNINDLLPPFRDLATRTIGANIEFGLELADGLWPVLVDPGELENALLNLAINARDAMPNGGQFTITTTNWTAHENNLDGEQELAPGDYVKVAVKDNGTGMSEQVSKRAFEPFFTTKEVGAGSGLGLSMVFGFAKQSGGLATLNSVDGEGSTINIYLPKAIQLASAENIQTATKSEIPKGCETILVVEDDIDIRDFLLRALKHFGYTVIVAEDGPAALDVMATSGDIDLLLTDVIMPRGMSGRDVAKAFSERYPTAGVLYSSGYAREALDQSGEVDEGETVLSKPYQAQSLAKMVRNALDQRA